MAEPGGGSHPDLEALAEFCAGALPAEAAAGIERHLAECPRCRLEAARIRRFAALEEDEELAAEADWPRAAAALDRAWRERIAPAARGERPIAGRIPRAGRLARRWYVPVIAAAALALVLLGPDLRRNLEAPRRGVGPVRGEESTASIVIEAPSGKVTAAPREFSWRAAAGFDSYALEVLTPGLDPVIRLDGLKGGNAALPDSLRARLLPGRTYLWDVKGYRGLAETSASPYAWFTIAGPTR